MGSHALLLDSNHQALFGIAVGEGPAVHAMLHSPAALHGCRGPQWCMRCPSAFTNLPSSLASQAGAGPDAAVCSGQTGVTAEVPD